MKEVKLYNTALYVVAIAFLLTVVAFLNRGFDFSDEGFYLLKLIRVDVRELDLMTFQRCFRLLFGFMEVNIVNVRLIRLLLTIFASLLFSLSLFSYLRNRHKELSEKWIWSLFPLFLISGLLSYGLGPQSLSYNTLTAQWVVITLSFYLFSLSASLVYRGIFVFLTGLSSVFVLFSKVPSGIFFIPVMLLCVLVTTSRMKQILLYLFLFPAGMALSLYYYSTIYGDLVSAFRLYQQTMMMVQSGSADHAYGDMLMNLAKSTLLVLLVFGVAGGGVLFIERFSAKPLWVRRSSVLTLLVVILSGVFYLPFSDRNLLLFPVALVLFHHRTYLVKCFSSFVISRKIDNRADWVLFALFLIAPFFTTIGTNTSMFNSTAYTLAPWFALFFIGIIFTETRIVKQLFFAIILSMSVVYLIRNFVFYPYRIRGLLNQTELYTDGFRHERILLDKETFRFVTTAKANLKKWHVPENATALGVSKIPGFIYLMNLESYGGVLWTYKDIPFFNRNLGYLYGRDGLPPQYILFRGKNKETFYESSLFKNQPLDALQKKNYQFVGNLGKIPDSNNSIYLFKWINKADLPVGN